MERLIEKSLFASRWILAPLFLGFALVLLAIVLKFFYKIFGIFSGIHTVSEVDLILSILTLIDMALIGNLVVMVMFSSYENFVSKIDLEEDTDRPGWLGKLGIDTLKLKVAASLVAISSIHLLKIFMQLKAYSSQELMWFVIIHMAFVLSALMLAWMERIAHSD